MKCNISSVVLTSAQNVTHYNSIGLKYEHFFPNTHVSIVKLLPNSTTQRRYFSTRTNRPAHCTASISFWRTEDLDLWSWQQALLVLWSPFVLCIHSGNSMGLQGIKRSSRGEHLQTAAVWQHEYILLTIPVSRFQVDSSTLALLTVIFFPLLYISYSCFYSLCFSKPQWNIFLNGAELIFYSVLLAEKKKRKERNASLWLCSIHCYPLSTPTPPSPSSFLQSSLCSNRLSLSSLLPVSSCDTTDLLSPESKVQPETTGGEHHIAQLYHFITCTDFFFSRLPRHTEIARPLSVDIL